MRSGHCAHHIGPSSCWYLPSVLLEVPQWHLQGNHIPVPKGCLLFETQICAWFNPEAPLSMFSIHCSFVIVHKQSNHKRLRALHNMWFGCLAWMLLLLVYSHHLWKNCISFLKHPIIQSNAIRREINTSGLSSQTKLSTSVFYFETLMRQW